MAEPEQVDLEALSDRPNFLEEPRLADACFALNEDQARAPRDRVVEPLRELLHLLSATDEGSNGPHEARWASGAIEARSPHHQVLPRKTTVPPRGSISPEFRAPADDTRSPDGFRHESTES